MTGSEPSFARTYPRNAELQALVSAFEAGDYARVREAAPLLAARADVPEPVRVAARDLRSRLDPDPLATYLLLLGVGLLVVITAWYFTHGH